MKKDLCLNKKGKVVSKRRMLSGKKNFKGIRGGLMKKDLCLNKKGKVVSKRRML